MLATHILHVYSFCERMLLEFRSLGTAEVECSPRLWVGSEHETGGTRNWSCAIVYISCSGEPGNEAMKCHMTETSHFVRRA